MKKTVRIVALAMALLMVGCLLAACGKTLSGKYSADFLGTGTTLEFSGKNVKLAVTVTMLGEVASINGTYAIDGDKITFDFIDEDGVENDKAKDVLSKMNGELDFEEGDGYIKIGGIKYTKK